MTRKIYLFCNAGMSTSMMADKMQKTANEHNLPLEIKAFPDGQLDQVVNEKHPDAILLGPQVKFLLEKVTARYGSLGVPIFVIDSTDYGNMDGERVLKKALIEIKNKEKGK